jgi:hypothetical protein
MFIVFGARKLPNIQMQKTGAGGCMSRRCCPAASDLGRWQDSK